MSDMYTSILNFTRRLFEIKSNGSFGLFPPSRTLLNHLSTPMLRPLLWPPPAERFMFHMMLVNTVVPSVVPSAVPSFHHSI